MAYKNSLLTGVTDLLVLFILDRQDSYVYDITKTISRESEGLLSISQNTIYTAVYKLEEAGMISEYSKLVGRKRTRVYYHLEPAGKEHLTKLSENYSNITNGVLNILNRQGDGASTDENAGT